MPPIHIEKLIFGGQALARVDGKAVFVWGALPGEDVEIEYTIQKKNFAEAVATKILTPSPDRIAPREANFLATSPWQILSSTAENKWKQQIAVETFGRTGGLILQENIPEIAFDQHQYEYRNKIEFYFTTTPNGEISLAFLERGTTQKIPVIDSALCKPVLNQCAQSILMQINKNQLDVTALHKLILKTNQKNQVIAGLLVNKKINKINLPLNNELIGFGIYDAHNNKALFEDGQLFLTDNILGSSLQHGLFSFFQINPPMFETALRDIAVFAGPKTPLVDYYSGVGAISIPISQNRESVELIDNNVEAIVFAKQNILANQIPNCTATCASSEEMLDSIAHDKIIILDPPRAGLDTKIINRLLTKKPTRIIYLSCDLATQARDINYLGQIYKITFLKLYNFFPRTPHIEALCVLDIG